MIPNLQGLFFICFCCFTFIHIQAQEEIETHEIRGIITDRNSNSLLENAYVELLNISPKKLATTDNNGAFKLEEVPVGRHRLLISKKGYEDVMVTDILVSSGKRLMIKVGLDEKLNQDDEDEVIRKLPRRNSLIAKTTKDKPNNQMAGISARPFTIEEVTRFAGMRFDPARMVTNYAGAAGYDDSRNDIVVRGQSPSHILWQIEELPIENPNHVSTIGTTGGVAPILNVYALGEADFMTGAFAAQYGNAIAGVFDLKLRSGSDADFGLMAQIGTQRGELMVEGPLGPKGNGASYLLSVRASLGNYLLDGIIPLDPNHRDINFKITTGRKRWGELEVFGIGGRSQLSLPYEETTYPDSNASPLIDFERRAFYNKVKYDIFEFEDYDHHSGMGLGGIKYTRSISSRTFWKTIAGVSAHTTSVRWTLNVEDATGNVQEQATTYSIDDVRRNYMLHSYMQSKINRFLTIKGGLMSNSYDLFLKEIYQYDATVDYDYDVFFTLMQGYFQTKYQVTNGFVINAGLHTQYLTLTNQFVAEPRLAMNAEVASGHIFSFGYGLHHQMPPYITAFFQPWVDETEDYYYDHPTELKFIGSHHLVGSYDWLINQNLRLRLEGYYTIINNVPVEQDSSAYSELNIGASFYDFYTGPLMSTGEGQNWGLELTLEKFFSNSYYGLLSASYFDSKATGSDGVWRNTLFNNQYIVNFLLGKEFRLGPTKQHVLFTDLRFSTTGGKPYTPIDLDATFNDPDGEENFVEEQTNALHLDQFYQVDFKIGLRLNANKMSHTIKIDLFNLTNLFGLQNPLTVRYSERFNPLGEPERGNQQTIYQRGFIPDLTYSIRF